MRISGWKHIVIGIICLGLFLFNSCIERFWPDTDDYENLLVVDGFITNEPPPYIIRLSKTNSIKQQIEGFSFIPLQNAVVKIHDSNNDIEEFYEINPGEYVSSESGMHCKVGLSYKVSIELPDGQYYESDFEEMLLSPAIDSLYAKYEEISTSDRDFNLQGYRFYIDINNTKRKPNYYLWKLSETYKFNSDFYIYWVWDERGVVPFINSDSLYTCWRSDNINEIFVYNTIHFSEGNIKRIPLNYVSNESKRLTIRYSLLVNQYSISENAYLYWDATIEQNTKIGSLYDKQPYQLRGNVKNINNPEEIILGYITFAAISKKRIFVDRPEKIEFVYLQCPYQDTLDVLFSRPERPTQYPIYFTENNGNLRWVDDCIDCTTLGGVLEEPEFWEE